MSHFILILCAVLIGITYLVLHRYLVKVSFWDSMLSLSENCAGRTFKKKAFSSLSLEQNMFNEMEFMSH